jgi:hypothetical protein
MPIHASFADWYRSAALTPPAGLLEKRWAAVEELARTATAETALGLLRLFALPRSDERAAPKGFSEAFRNHDDTFPNKDNLQELRVLAGAVLRMIIEHKFTAATMAALGLVCASFATRTAFISTKDHLDASERFLLTEGAAERQVQVTTIAPPALTRQKYDELLPAASFVPNELPTLHEQLFSVMKELIDTQVAAFSQTQSAFRDLIKQSHIQQEDINFVWWLQNAFSRDLRRTFRDIGAKAGALIFAKELADLTIFLPGPEAMLGVMLHALESAAGEPIIAQSTVAECVNAAPRSWRENLSISYPLTDVNELCPVSLAVRTSLDTEGADEWFPVYLKACDVAVDCSMPLPHLSLQLYRERLFLRSVASKSK